MVDRSAVFVLAACDDGPMLVARTDAQPVGGGRVVGVGAALLETGSHSQGEIDVLLKLSMARARQKPVEGFMVLDVGANVGSHTVSWAKYMTGWGSLIAIEAQERIFGALWGNITLNNLFNARAVWGAVSDQCGFMPGPKVDYHRLGNFGGVSMLPQHNDELGAVVRGYSSIIPMLTIDSLNLTRVDIIKIDVEGMEPKVLKGAEISIRRHRPIIAAEHTTCGEEAILKALPDDYRCQTQGMTVLAMHKDDTIWQMITADAA